MTSKPYYIPVRHTTFVDMPRIPDGRIDRDKFREWATKIDNILKEPGAILDVYWSYDGPEFTLSKFSESEEDFEVRMYQYNVELRAWEKAEAARKEKAAQKSAERKAKLAATAEAKRRKIFEELKAEFEGDKN